ncbi:DUF222 domain-containing protein [Nocardioides limicola]|uniref:DUF222 domain-containing protein n=1 Tax=Nocardioides limicola TaxID=2803368 RepID=UPI00193C11C1|nr:DUF222 domain-containing protein [Nocardioides sp. DJM-14]
MAEAIAFDEMTGTGVLDAVEMLALRQRHTEVELIRAAAEWAAINGPDSLDPRAADLPGRETARHYGGPGTPYVASFAGATLGARLGKSSYAGEQLIATALDLQYRFPQLWQRVQALEVEASYARFVTRRCRDLSLEQAKYVDSRVAESADGRISWSQFETLVEASIVGADPEAARQREEAARREQFARATRSTGEGMRGFYLRTDAAGIARVDATVAYLAEALRALGSDAPEDHRRAMAMVLLANPAYATRFLAQYAAWKQRPTDGEPATSGIVDDAVVAFRRGGGQPTGDAPVIDWRALLPRLTLYLHMYGGDLVGGAPVGGAAQPVTGLVKTDTCDTARLEGIGPVTEAWARQTLGEKASFVIRPVLDPLGLAPVHSYEIPDRHRQAVCLLTPADVFPFSPACVNDGWSSMQIDHTVPWREPGSTHGDEPGSSRIGNYGPMTAFHHRVKTHGRWKVAQPFPAVYLWRDPHGATYLVDHTGTRRLRTPIAIDLVDYSRAA